MTPGGTTTPPHGGNVPRQFTFSSPADLGGDEIASELQKLLCAILGLNQ
jgi:hypothetical protein